MTEGCQVSAFVARSHSNEAALSIGLRVKDFMTLALQNTTLHCWRVHAASLKGLSVE